MENFVNELLSYSQSQNNKITSMTSKLQERKGDDSLVVILELVEGDAK
jgi:hypothetical protein